MALYALIPTTSKSLFQGLVFDSTTNILNVFFLDDSGLGSLKQLGSGTDVNEPSDSSLHSQYHQSLAAELQSAGGSSGLIHHVRTLGSNHAHLRFDDSAHFGGTLLRWRKAGHLSNDEVKNLVQRYTGF